MAKEPKIFSCEVLSPDGTHISTDAVTVTFPGSDGQVGILADRAPLVASIGAGVLSIQAPGRAKDRYYVAGGFVQVRENVMTVFADECIAVSAINPEEAWSGIEAARAMPQETPEQTEVRDRALAAAQSKFRLAQAYRAAQRRGGDEEEPEEPMLY